MQNGDWYVRQKIWCLSESDVQSRLCNCLYRFDHKREVLKMPIYSRTTIQKPWRMPIIWHEVLANSLEQIHVSFSYLASQIKYLDFPARQWPVTVGQRHGLQTVKCMSNTINKIICRFYSRTFVRRIFKIIQCSSWVFKFRPFRNIFILKVKP